MPSLPKRRSWSSTAPDLATGREQGVDRSPSERVERLRREVGDRDPLDQMMYVDLRLWLPDDPLLVGDKMSMAESVEMRVRFLDPALVDFVESLPSSYKIRRGRRKAVEKAALESLLPRAIIHRKERGFITPIDRWLRSKMCQWPSVSPQVRPSVLPTGGHLFSPLVAMSSPHDRVGERPPSRGPRPEGEACVLGTDVEIGGVSPDLEP